ncbi:DUF317 domain-containing protein [Streptomyces sp. RPT161]|uniref:DUF317 domain-containing protein n=1 Tax=Streptomyces sp. RPT161 TaxID=3015993 RepID=UPI003FCC5594
MSQGHPAARCGVPLRTDQLGVKAREADPTWRARFTPSVPTDAIRAFTAALLATS